MADSEVDDLGPVDYIVVESPSDPANSSVGLTDRSSPPRNGREPTVVERRPSAREPLFLNCPRCGLSIRPRRPWLGIEHCPRCLARSRILVRLFASRLPADELYATAWDHEAHAQRLPAHPCALTSDQRFSRRVVSNDA
jgi:hypothetical protein